MIQMPWRMSEFKWEKFKSPWLIIIGMAAGVLAGIFNRGLALKLAPLGDAYLSFLSMCVIPIMATAIVTSFGRLFRSREVSFFLRRIIVVLLLAMFISSLVGMAAAVIGNPGRGLGDDTLETLGKVLVQYEQSDPEKGRAVNSFGLNEFINMIIPANIFNALYEGKNLQILFFSIVLGLTTGLLPSQKAELFLDITEVVFKAFEKAISVAMYFLPLGLLCLLAGQIAHTGVDILLAMTRFVVIIHIAGLALVLLGSVVIAFTAGVPLVRSFKDLREPLIIAFGTRNSYATIPSVFNVLHNNFNLPQNLINMVAPMGIVMCRYSMVLTFTIGTVFIAQLYKMPLGASQLAFIFFVSVVAALAGAGSPGVVAISMVSIVLSPLGLPSGSAVILLLAVNAIIDPILTVVNVHMTCAASVLITGGARERKDLLSGNVKNINGLLKPGQIKRGGTPG